MLPARVTFHAALVTYAIFRPEDAPVLEYREDDGATVSLFSVPIKNPVPYQRGSG
jgi:hypothetical protein